MNNAPPNGLWNRLSTGVNNLYDFGKYLVSNERPPNQPQTPAVAQNVNPYSPFIRQPNTQRRPPGNMFRDWEMQPYHSNAAEECTKLIETRNGLKLVDWNGVLALANKEIQKQEKEKALKESQPFITHDGNCFFQPITYYLVSATFN
jgi:hypothetical protein